MIIALFSDSHDHTDALTWAIDTAARRGAAHGIHCGDLIAGFSAQILAAAPFPVFAVFGNNDGDRARLQEIAAASDGTLTYAGAMTGEITLDGQRIFCCHYPHDAEAALARGGYDAVFYGHTHRYETHVTLDGVTVCNPGELYGGRTGVTSFALYDTATRTVEFVIRDREE